MSPALTALGRRYSRLICGDIGICLKCALSAILRCCVLRGRRPRPAHGWQSRAWQTPPARSAFSQGTQTEQGFERNFDVVMIRLARVGARKQPYYRVVV